MINLQDLNKHLLNTGVLKTPSITKAFYEVDRKDFVAKEYLNEAYDDHALPIGEGQTISQPTTVAIMLELLQPQEGDRILDVGSGSGWTTALLANIVGSRGRVFGVEIQTDLVNMGKKNIEKFSNSSIQKPKGLGLKDKAPFDRILVSAAAYEIPQELVDQLKNQGVMVIPIENSIVKVVKKEQTLETEQMYGFAFVPLKT